VDAEGNSGMEDNRQGQAKGRQEVIAQWARRWRISRGMSDPKDAASYTGDSGFIGPGWMPILERLAADLVALGWNRQLHQVKQKFGALRFYIGAGTDAIAGRIEEATAESLKTCEECGERASLIKTASGWWRTLCPPCAANADAAFAANAEPEPDPLPPPPDYDIVFSGTCLCGHEWEAHRLVLVEDPDLGMGLSGTSQVPHECEFYGRNAAASRDDAGGPHCLAYVDRTDPAPARHARWRAELEAARGRSSS
jgi:hypothetical protein